MSNGREHHDSPPEFGDDDTKDDDQMFKSASLPVTDDIPLSGDDDEENPFGDSSVVPKSSTSINQASAATNNETPFHVSSVTSIDTSEVKTENKTLTKDSNLNSTETNISATQSHFSTTGLETQTSGSTQVSKPATTGGSSSLVAHMKPAPTKSEEPKIEITVSDPTRVGEVRFLPFFK